MQDVLVLTDKPISYINFYRNAGVFPQAEISFKLTTTISWPELLNYKILYLQNPWNEGFLQALNLAKQLNKKVWVDFTFFPFDARDKYDPLYETINDNEFNQSAITSILKECDIITVPNSILKEKFKYFNHNCSVIENSLDSQIIKTIDSFNLQSKTILWRGISWSRTEIMSNFEKLEKVISEYPEYKFVFVGETSDFWILENYENVEILKNLGILEYFYTVEKRSPQVFITFNSETNYAFQEALHFGAIHMTVDKLKDYLEKTNEEKNQIYRTQRTAASCGRLKLQNLLRKNIVTTLTTIK